MTAAKYAGRRRVACEDGVPRAADLRPHQHPAAPHVYERGRAGNRPRVAEQTIGAPLQMAVEREPCKSAFERSVSAFGTDADLR